MCIFLNDQSANSFDLHVFSSEQCVPIFGLSALEASPPSGEVPHTTLNKAIFLVRYIIIEPRAHWFTACVGFGTLTTLLIVRGIKRVVGKRWTWVKWVPEVLLGVIFSTGMTSSNIRKVPFQLLAIQH